MIFPLESTHIRPFDFVQIQRQLSFEVKRHRTLIFFRYSVNSLETAFPVSLSTADNPSSVAKYRFPSKLAIEFTTTS